MEPILLAGLYIVRITKNTKLYKTLHTNLTSQNLFKGYLSFYAVYALLDKGTFSNVVP